MLDQTNAELSLWAVREPPTTYAAAMVDNALTIARLPNSTLKALCS